MDIIETHLGVDATGTRAPAYVTPFAIDPTLLVAVPRCVNREQYDLKENDLPFIGYDIWNSYEFSALTNNGFPIVGQLKIVYSALSLNIVESKSLKLYLNSFNMVRLGETRHDVEAAAERIIFNDLKRVLGTEDDLDVRILAEPHTNHMPTHPFPMERFTRLDNYVRWDGPDYVYSEDASLLQINISPSPLPFDVKTSVLRSNCRVTHQPDWGDVYIHLMGPMKPTEESVLRYIVSLRNENHFHEEICECIYKRLWDKFHPQELLVACFYTRRGGIDINPIRSTSEGLIRKTLHHMIIPTSRVEKAWRQ